MRSYPQLVFASLIEGGLEFRGELIRTVQTLRGGVMRPGIFAVPRA